MVFEFFFFVFLSLIIEKFHPKTSLFFHRSIVFVFLFFCFKSRRDRRKEERKRERERGNTLDEEEEEEEEEEFYGVSREETVDFSYGEKTITGPKNTRTKTPQK